MSANENRTVNVAWHDAAHYPRNVWECKILADADDGIIVTSSVDGLFRTRVPLPDRQQTRLDLARLIAGDEYRVVPAKDEPVDADVMIADLRAILDALGLRDHPPHPPHECVTRDVLPAIERLKRDNGRLRDRNQQLYSEANQAQAAQPDRPEPVNPASPDPEIAALHQIVAAMSTLDVEQQARTARYLSARYGDADSPFEQMRATLQQVPNAD